MRLVEDLDLAILDGEAVGFSHRTRRIVSLNGPATAVVQALLDGYDADDVLDVLAEVNPDVDGRCVLAALVDAGVVADDLPSPLDDGGTATEEPDRPGCSDPVGRLADAPGVGFRAVDRHLSLRSNDPAFVARVAERLPAAHLDPDGALGWALSVHVPFAPELGERGSRQAVRDGRGVRRLAELRFCGRVVRRSSSVAELEQLAAEWLAFFAVVATADHVPVAGAVAVQDRAATTGVLEIGTVGEDLRLDRADRPAAVLAAPGVVVGRDGTVQLPAELLGAPTGLSLPGQLRLGVPPGLPAGATAAAVIAAVPPAARTGSVDDMLVVLRALPWVPARRARVW